MAHQDPEAYRIIQTLRQPGLNKGTAFSEEERSRYGLLGLLPPHISTLEEQVQRTYDAYSQLDSNIERHIYLRGLQDRNETLFYSLVLRHLKEMMPMIYTPVVGEACQKFSHIYRVPRGLFIGYPYRDRIDEILDNSPVRDVRVIVVSDGERILGLGDQGAGGMGIPIGKLSLYSAVGGVDPSYTLPILLDVGTNNEERLNDPLYIGWRNKRIAGAEYDDFLDRFVQAVKRKWPDVLLQFEDFAQTHASPLLKRYRDQLCTFNDDIQGTAAVAVGSLLAATKITGVPLKDRKVVFLGAGSAGCGIAEQIVAAMVRQGASEADARGQIFMVDRYGLVHDGMTNLLAFQTPLAQAQGGVQSWASAANGEIGVEDVIRHAEPSILIGVSGQPGLFTENAVRQMASTTDRPIIFPLSNPTSRAEAVPEDLIAWTEGRALVATGSPFEPVSYNGTSYKIGQSNNTYIFPAMGLAKLAVGATRITDNMFMAASEAMADVTVGVDQLGAALVPPIEDIRTVSLRIARAVALQAQVDGVATKTSADEVDALIAAAAWAPSYADMTHEPLEHP